MQTIRRIDVFMVCIKHLSYLVGWLIVLGFMFYQQYSSHVTAAPIWYSFKTFQKFL